MDSHECHAVKSLLWAKRNSDVFSVRWNCPSVGVMSRNDQGSEFQLVGLDTAKLRACPYVDVLVRGTARSPRVEERRQL